MILHPTKPIPFQQSALSVDRRQLSLAILLAARLVDMKMFFVRQLFDKFLIRCCHCIACLSDLLDKEPRRHFQGQGVGEELLDRFVRHVPAPFQIGGQGDEFRSEKTGFCDFLRQFGNVVTLVFFAPIPELLEFCNDKWIAEVLFVPFLFADFPFLFSFVFLFRRLDDVGGWRFGGGGGVF
jgi:hypothetical protein